MPNFLITEYFVNFEETGNEISVDPLTVEGGYIDLPDRPGLGLDLDEQALLANPYVERSYHEEGPPWGAGIGTPSYTRSEPSP